mmetsp:Transcript_22679/g.37520  ORF Transcript_22679/g.37520 Transcript_22679/m.37520 type:complete len:211 (-) Transcript_22679:483-1115(-)
MPNLSDAVSMACLIVALSMLKQAMYAFTQRRNTLSFGLEGVPSSLASCSSSSSSSSCSSSSLSSSADSSLAFTAFFFLVAFFLGAAAATFFAGFLTELVLSNSSLISPRKSSNRSMSASLVLTPLRSTVKKSHSILISCVLNLYAFLEAFASASSSNLLRFSSGTSSSRTGRYPLKSNRYPFMAAPVTFPRAVNNNLKAARRAADVLDAP